jgi:hypothetical protein
VHGQIPGGAGLAEAIPKQQGLHASARGVHEGPERSNAEVNRRVGIRRSTDATVDQLENRLVAAERWLEKR